MQRSGAAIVPVQSAACGAPYDPVSGVMVQRLDIALTPLDAALAALLDGLAPVAPVALPLADALGCVAADMPQLKPYPQRDIAAADGWALRARDLVGASSYSPLPLATPVLSSPPGGAFARSTSWSRARPGWRS
jgi:molybdopterin biosynthesis enzyme